MQKRPQVGGIRKYKSLLGGKNAALRKNFHCERKPHKVELLSGKVDSAAAGS
jgi:hypothetical protein